MSQVKDTRAQHRYNTKQVYWLCKIDRERLAIFADSLLTDWLSHYFPDWTADEWKESTLLLKWWTHNWCLRDESILPVVYAEFPIHRLTIYRQQHQEIFSDILPVATMLRADFRALIPDFVDEIVAKTKGQKEVANAK